ncbi:hypothetical protein OWR29_26405 [Actinoplanes sp. Pm04-4]|uniref:Uncharacterized protein n=1 Tax=Paractinoplanes pyxinae TaxID=2997416 RepID=A0ABT4B4X3_9ACTN|nr:hypothetical protein [Actinoplanes pyxinae]MCY1141545.1 hypothetical protein [Actinoplanes pyxinae]
MPDETAQGLDSLRPIDSPVVDFEIDCGELVPGHRVVLTGLSDNGRSRSDLTSREQEMACQTVSLEYALIPGVRPDEVVEGFDEEFMLLAGYHADVELPWTTAGFSGVGPSGIDLFDGGERTNGTLGPWPVPDGARRLTFVLRRPPSSRVDPHTPVAGTLDVDLVERVAEWAEAS